MKKMLRVGSIMMLALACVFFCACNSVEESSYEYEKPLETLVLAVKNKDNNSYVRCFAPTSADSYFKENQDVTVAEDIYNSLKEIVGEAFSFSYKVSDRDQLDDEELEDLEEQVKNGVSIKKAYNLDVTFTAVNIKEVYTCEKTIYVGKIDQGWYICGPVDGHFNFTQKK